MRIEQNLTDIKIIDQDLRAIQYLNALIAYDELFSKDERQNAVFFLNRALDEIVETLKGKGLIMARLAFKVSDSCLGADNEALLKEFKKHLYTYKVKSVKGVEQAFIDCSYDLFYTLQTQRKSIYELEKRLNIRSANDNRGLLL